MTNTEQTLAPPYVRLVGQYEHADFADTVKLLRAEAQIFSMPDVQPDLIVVAQSRPDAISGETVESLRRDFRSAGLVSLLGTWCEGETRTGRPWPGVQRLYWYEFAAWWKRQLAIRDSGGTPDWARAGDCGIVNPANGNCLQGPILIHTSVRETAIAITELLAARRYSSIWQQPSRKSAAVQGMLAGIWDGTQLCEREEKNLAAFCKVLKRDLTPAIALLDFPRSDRSQRARQLGAAAILGKPWLNVELLGMIEHLTRCRSNFDHSKTCCAA